MSAGTYAQTRSVAFLGEHGAFSEEAAIELLGEQCEFVPCPTFEALLRPLMRELPKPLLCRWKTA